MEKLLQRLRALRVTELCEDSRRVSPSRAFVCLPPATPKSQHGKNFAEQALAQGSPVVLGEGPAPEGLARDKWLQCDSIRESYPRIAAELAGHPSRSLQMAGVTGTDGKTSVAWVFSHLLEALDGQACGRVGTLGWSWGAVDRPSDFTTPPAAQLQPGLAAMLADGVKTAVMEVSSHALSLGRVVQLDFDVACLTTLGRDHLDFHGDLQTYHETKLGFLSQRRADCTLVMPVSIAEGLNGDQPHLTVGPGGDFEQARTGPRSWALRTPAGRVEMELPLFADFQVDNLLFALAMSQALGRDLNRLVPLCADLPSVPGRLERVGDQAVVDFAHTPEALTALHQQLKPAVSGRLITVFGCGGDRDPGKRQEMAARVQQGADLAILTTDNPRSEDPETILDQAQTGFTGSPLSPGQLAEGDRGWLRIADRRKAIDLAWSQSRPGDLVVVAGKGAETYQEVAGERLPFDDRDELRRVMERPC